LAKRIFLKVRKDKIDVETRSNAIGRLGAYTPDHMVHVVEFEARPMYDTYLKP
jgi:hypothetical protein